MMFSKESFITLSRSVLLLFSYYGSRISVKMNRTAISRYFTFSNFVPDPFVAGRGTEEQYGREKYRCILCQGIKLFSTNLKHSQNSVILKYGHQNVIQIESFERRMKVDHVFINMKSGVKLLKNDEPFRFERAVQDLVLLKLLLH